MKQEYPKWLYHATEKACIVPDAEAHAKLGPGWYRSPADIPAADKPPAHISEAAAVTPPSPEPATVAAVSVPVAVPANTAPTVAVEIDTAPTTVAVDPVKAEAAALYGANVSAVVSRLKGCSKDVLEHLLELEARNPKGARKGVMTAIEAELVAVTK